MCVAVPGRIVDIEEGAAVIEIGGVRRRVSLMLLPDARVKEYVLVHAGFAIQRVDEKEALETIKVLEEMLQSSVD